MPRRFVSLPCKGLKPAPPTMQLPIPYGLGSPLSLPGESPPDIHRIPQPDEAGKEVVAVVITAGTQTSYDPLFRMQPQVSPEGRVAVYNLRLVAVPRLLEKLHDPCSSADFDELMLDIAAVEPENVVLNFECCAGCGASGYPFNKVEVHKVLSLTRAMLDRKHMVMFSDFSLKDLIRSWDESLLGPRVLKEEGECNASITLRFDPCVLKDCPSAQLMKLAELCSEGEATVKALGGTIVFSALEQPPSAPYDVEVLTVATALNGVKAPAVNEVGSNAGTAGHVLLRYHSGGTLLCSAGHWLELSRINTTEENVMHALRKQYGVEYSARVEREYRSLPSTQQACRLQALGAQCIQQSTPCRSTRSAA